MKYCFSVIGRNLGIVNNMDEYQVRCTKWKSPDSKGCVLCDFPYMASWNRRETMAENKSVIAGGWEWTKELAIEELFRGLEMFYVLTVVVGTQLYVLDKSHRTVH